MRYFRERPRRSRKSATLIVRPFCAATFASISREDGAQWTTTSGERRTSAPLFRRCCDEADDDLRLRPERLRQVEVPGRLEARLAPRLLDPLREAAGLVGDPRRRRAREAPPGRR